MTFLLLNQTFHPDLSATGQYLSDLALGLVQKGHQVTVITSRRAYETPSVQFRQNESWKGIRILRVNSTGFGKRTRLGRAIDAFSFLLSCGMRLLRSRRPDVVVVLTSPPLIAFLAVVFAIVRRCRLCYWVMDFNPDEAIAAGWLRSDSIVAKVLNRISAWTLNRSTKIIALDRFMRDRIVARVGSDENIAVLPLWSRDAHVTRDREGRHRFRAQHGLERKFVVMYAGNHSPCHSLDSLVLAAESLATDPGIAFYFVGGGTDWHRLRRPAANMVFLPYQPLDQLSACLSAADLQVIVMGDRFVGLVHPCKLYNLLKIGAPLLYIGPPQSHVTELLRNRPNNGFRLLVARHGEVQRIAEQIQGLRANGAASFFPDQLSNDFSQERILSRMIEMLEAL